ncbi:MAG: hypothetical protein IPO70_14825 [Bacteroidetes bacterium]|nr:hypothetical protein [Bacteroidota bacterium]
MSFVTVKNNARARFDEVRIYLDYLSSIEPADRTIPITLELKIMKGLFQVHLYSSFEKTINELIVNTLRYIGSNNVSNIDYNVPFNTISLVNKLKAFKDSGHKQFFNKSIEIFAEMTSSDVGVITETTFDKILQNVWIETVEQVLKSFGIMNFVIPSGVRVTINELVEKRNAVAHGRESASVVGERFRTDVMRVKMEVVINFANELIELFENYYSNKKFLKGHAKRHYTLIT